MNKKPIANLLPQMPVPDWLVSEAMSPEAAGLRREWAAAAGGGDADMRRLGTAMLRLQAQRPVQPLLSRANAKALRFVDSALRRSRMCRQLRDATPQLPLRTRMALATGRWALTAAATVVLLLCKSGVFSTLDGVSRVADRMSKTHVDRHIGPLV